MPLLLKIAPDLTFRNIDGILRIISDQGFAGIVATNTTLERPGKLSGVRETGGLSGQPLHSRAVEIVKYIHRSTSGKLTIIGVGGIDCPRTAGHMADAGASLIQIYTGMVYRGPFVAKPLAKALAPRLSGWV